MRTRLRWLAAVRDDASRWPLVARDGGLEGGVAMGQRPSNGELSAVETSPLVRLARSRLLAAGQEQWIVQADEIWCLLRPPAHVGRLQGWKLHLSCTSDSAFDVLDAALAVLLPAGCQFKFASTPARVRELTGGRYTRSGAGKFVTVYPDDDEQFRRLARELHEATDGLAGPTILSDRPYCPGSLVHYRYGAFRGLRTLSNDGEYLAVIAAPDGQLVEIAAMLGSTRRNGLSYLSPKRQHRSPTRMASCLPTGSWCARRSGTPTRAASSMPWTGSPARK